MSNSNCDAGINKKPDMQNGDIAEAQPVSAEMLLGKALLQCSEQSNAQIIRSVLESLIPLGSQLSTVENQQKQSCFQLDSIKQILSDLSSHSKLLEEASKTNRTLTKEHYEQCIVEPMVRSLFPVIDFVEDGKKMWTNNEKFEEEQIEFLELINTLVLQFLSNYGIEIIRHAPDAMFQPQLMKPVCKVSTTNEELDGCIAESLQVGFRWHRQRLLRHETVSLYTFEKTNTNLSQKGSNYDSRN
jgi:molecular chaperone GrpE (heat shock protein)